MLRLAWLLPALPFAGFVALALLGRRLPRATATAVGVGSVGLAFAVAVAIGAAWLAAPPAGGAYVQHLWRWFDVAGFAPDVALFVDPLALVMCGVVTGVGFLIHVYATEYMRDEPGYARFFASMNLFVGSMLTLVLADDLLLLYLGWEGVGLCSYLLIGFWYRDAANGRAARKAFVVTRVGDTAFAIALFLIVRELGTLEIDEVLVRAAAQWPAGGTLAILVAALLLAGAAGKSAQAPLQVWLPDAMAGPTPVSALIHAATMVTAGVYLIARMNVLFALAPPVMTAVMIVGAATLLLGAFSALAQRDLKRVLAYSTISQIGYMFLALGVGAWSAAVFHLMTHAFFKALLFLGAGAVLLATHHEGDVLKLGGLRRRLPVTFWTFVIGGAALAGVPLVTAGFFSKDAILWEAWSRGGPVPWAVGLLGAFLTALYVSRVILLTFFGEQKHAAEPERGLRIQLPLVALAALSIGGGWVHGGFDRFLAGDAHGGEALFEVVAAVISLAGVGVAWLAWRRGLWARPDGALQRFWRSGWGFDAVYHTLFVRPYVWFARANARDVFDRGADAIAGLARGGNRLLVASQDGRVRTYVAGLALGAVVLLAIGVIFARPEPAGAETATEVRP